MLQDGLTVPDVLNTCKFYMDAGITLDQLADLFSAITGWEFNGFDLMTIGERALNLQRMFNVREGLSRRDDYLPERAMQQPAFGDYKDESRCKISNYDDMLNEYYRARGWDTETGIPTSKKIIQLGLEQFL